MRVDYIDCVDCFQGLREIPDDSVSLVVTDPPYNIGKDYWDSIEGYVDWCVEWLLECQRVLKPNGVLYVWHNDMEQIAQLMEAIRTKTAFRFISFIVWKKDWYRTFSWKNRKEGEQRSFFNICEYCLHFFNFKGKTNKKDRTGLQAIYDDPNSFASLKSWYRSEKQRLGLTDKDIRTKYEQVTKKRAHMVRHYFADFQFDIPTQKIWESVFVPLGFSKNYEELRREYEELRREYEELRPVHKISGDCSNVFQGKVTGERLHSCQKPLTIIEKLVRCSSREGDVVLDPFMGSATTAIACMHTGRHYIGFEFDAKNHEKAINRINQDAQQLTFEM